MKKAGYKTVAVIISEEKMEDEYIDLVQRGKDFFLRMVGNVSPYHLHDRLESITPAHAAHLKKYGYKGYCELYEKGLIGNPPEEI